MITDLLTLPFLGPLKGLTWVADKIREQAELQLPSEQTIRRDLTELQLRMDLGEIDEEEFEREEELLLQQLRELRNAEAAEQQQASF